MAVIKSLTTEENDQHIKKYSSDYSKTALIVVLFFSRFFFSINPGPAFANSVDPDRLASEEANRSGSALFVIKYVNLYQQPG